MAPKMIIIIIATILLGSLCSAQENVPILPDQFKPMAGQFEEPYLPMAVGKYSLMATSDPMVNFTTINFYQDNGRLENAILADISWGPGPEENGKIEITGFGNYRGVFKFVWNGQYSQLPARTVAILHHNDQYLFIWVYIPDRNHYVLQVLSKADKPFDPDNVMNLFLNRILPNKNVRPIIEKHVFSLHYLKPDLSGFYPQEPRHIEENEIAEFDSEMMTGSFNLYASTETHHIFDHSQVEKEQGGDVFKVFMKKDDQLIAVKTIYRVPNSRRTVAVFRPEADQLKAHYPENVRSIPIYSDYLYADGDTLFMYQWCHLTGKEMLHVIVRDGQQVSNSYTSIAASEKIRDLLLRLRVIVKTDQVIPHSDDDEVQAAIDSLRASEPFDPDTALDTFYTKFSTTKTIIEQQVFNLVWWKPDTFSFYPKPPRCFTDHELAQFDFDQVVGDFSVHATTEDHPLSDRSVRQIAHGGHAFRVFIKKGDQLLAVKSVYRVSYSRRTFSVLRPEAQELKAKFGANVGSVPKYTAYLYVDGNTLFVYEWCPLLNKESLKVIVRDGRSVSDGYRNLSPTALDKIKDLLPKLKIIEKTVATTPAQVQPVPVAIPPKPKTIPKTVKKRPVKQGDSEDWAGIIGQVDD